jgi:UDP:flavonoid glycosyltransferase YjiC (YdhE family)
LTATSDLLMSRILYSWELGEDLGHTSNFLPLAASLRSRGHEIVAALRELPRSDILGKHGITLFQAPLWQGPPHGLPNPPLSFAEILFHFGYLDGAGLVGMLRGWRSLLRLVAPDLMIADHAPTALLAARTLGIPSATFGHGFFLPPSVSPMPNMRPWMQVPFQRLIDSERRALTVINGALAEFGARALDRLADIYDVADHFLMTYSELDHYPGRGAARYEGVILSAEEGLIPDWPADGGKKVFAYLKPHYADFEKLLIALAALDCRVIVYCPGLGARDALPFQDRRIHISAHPYNIHRAAAECDLAICHGGQGTVVASLLAGKPLLLLPLQLEQHLLSLRAAEFGAGVMIDFEVRDKDFAGAAKHLLDDPRFALRARDFALRYGDLAQDRIIASIADRCERILAIPGDRMDRL